MKLFFTFTCRCCLLALVSLAGCGNGKEVTALDSISSVTAAERVDKLADQYLTASLKYHPEQAYFFGLELERHDGFSDNSAGSLASWHALEEDLYRQLNQIPEEQVRGQRQWVTRGILLEELEASIEQRVCRLELWNISQLSGLHLHIGQLAQIQPLGTPDLEQQALARWQKIVRYIDLEVINLQRGIERGYSAPGPAVLRVVQQLDGLLALDFRESPVYSLVERGESAPYLDNMKVLLQAGLLPAFEKYRGYLEETYLPAARDELAVSANPDGAACYRALLRTNTTLRKTPEQVYELGEKVVTQRTQKVASLGREYFDTGDFTSTVNHIDTMKAGRFNSREEVLTFSKQAVERAASEVPKWFGRLPQSAVTISPFPKYLEGTGQGAHYAGPGQNKPEGTYWIPLYQPEQQLRGRVEVTAFHETYPGHHLQIAIAQELGEAHQVSRLIANAGFVEGWGRYAEELAEEMGLYSTKAALISRRTWPARGMVVDPGIHAFGWTRQQALDYIEASGNFTGEVAEAMVDRIAIMPGQLTSYDSGGLEIFALRKKAEEKLGDQFEIRDFHDRVLENGSVTLPMLRSHIKYWIDGMVP